MKPTPPTAADINRTLSEIERSELPEDHPRNLARAAVEKWKSNAERGGLPTVNTTTGSGAPLLDRDKVLKWEPKHMGRK